MKNEKEYMDFVSRMGSFDDEMNLSSEVSLKHYGVLGMKWGKSRAGKTVSSFNNKHLTKEGKKKVDTASSIVNESKNINNNIRNIRMKKKKNAIDLSSMSDKDLQQQINRMNMENNYTNLIASRNVTKGEEFASRTLEVAGSVLAVTGSAVTIALGIKELRKHI